MRDFLGYFFKCEHCFAILAILHMYLLNRNLSRSVILFILSNFVQMSRAFSFKLSILFNANFNALYPSHFACTSFRSHLAWILHENEVKRNCLLLLLMLRWWGTLMPKNLARSQSEKGQWLLRRSSSWLHSLIDKTARKTAHTLQKLQN